MVRYTRIIFFIFLLVVPLELLAKNPPPGTGTSDIPANILIMLDNSGSMRTRLSTSTNLYYPVDVETDSSGNIYVLEYAYDRIKKFDSAGNYLRSFGRYGTNCNQWRDARQFQVYGDRIYIADHTGNRLVVLDLNGSCVDTTSTRFSRPNGIAVNNNFIFVGNVGSTIETFRRSNNSQYNFQSHGTGDINYAWGMSFNSAGNRLIISSIRGIISEYATSGDGSLLTLQQKLSRSRSITDSGFDSSGNIYATEISRLRKYNSSLTYLSQKTGFRNPYGMHTDSSDNIFVSDYRGHRVVKYDTNLNQLMQIGGGRSATRISAAKKVIRQIVSNTDLTSGANFGLMEWGSPNRMRLLVPISDTGASRIYNSVGRVSARGGTDLNYALNFARRYYTGQTRYGSVPNYGQDCAQNYIIVISDGIWMNHPGVISQATSLKDQHKVKTFAVGFALSGANSRYSTLATAGGTTTPLYADNEAQLLATLTDAIKQAISGRLTFTTPAVMSDVQKGDFVYQATFEYASNKQWEGRIKKHKLNNNGSLGAVSWDAAEKLNDRTSERNIWTTGITSSGLNNFVTNNRDELASLIFPTSSPTNTQLDNLINFVRGIDTYDQDGDGSTTDNIHKLADVYHSNLIVVGAPEASSTTSNTSNFDKTDTKYRIDNNYDNFKINNSCGVTCTNREEVIYAGANNGILHAFKTSDGEELWGFIPPAVAGNLERIPSTKANATNPIYGVDGSPIVKDIYFDDTPNDNISNPRWRTILISGLGGGGNGFFALDVTNVNSPKQIFSIKNDPVNQVITHWDSTGLSSDYSYAGGSILPEFDFRKLGETWSSPRVIRIKVDGKDRWVSVFGGGYNQAVNPNYGSAVFVIDMENEGKLLKSIEIEDKKTQTGGSSGTLFSRVGGVLEPDPTTGTENTLFKVHNWNPNICYDPGSGGAVTAEFTPAVSYVINFKTVGSLECVDTVDFDTPWPGTRDSGNTGTVIFRIMSNDIVNSVPADLTVITADGTGKANYEGALVYATDLEGKVTKIDLTKQFTIDTDSSSSGFKTIKEDIGQTTLFITEATSDNGRFIYTRPSATINNDSNLWLYFGTGNTQKLQEQSNQIQNRLYGIKDKDFPNFALVSPTGDISKCKTAPNCPNSSDLGWYVNLPNYQKLSAEPTVDKNRVYFPIYEPTTGTNACKTGKAILTGYDTKCGNSVLNVTLGTGVLSKVVVQGDNIYIGIAGEAKENIDGFTSSENLITGKSGAQATGGTVQTQYWREID